MILVESNIFGLSSVFPNKDLAGSSGFLNKENFYSSFFSGSLIELSGKFGVVFSYQIYSICSIHLSSLISFGTVDFYLDIVGTVET